MGTSAGARCAAAALLTGLAVLGTTPSQAADTVDELLRTAEFTFGVVTDNQGWSPINLIQFARADEWVKYNCGHSFMLGCGDHIGDPIDGAFANFIRTDWYWHNYFYPNPGDHDNSAYGGGWGTGGAIFYEVDLYDRPWVTIRPNGCEYYAGIAVGDWTVHVIAIHIPDHPPDPVISFPEDSRQYLIDTLQSITRGPKDIIICTAHSIQGYWVHHLSPERQAIVMETADFCFAGTSHCYERYIDPTYGDTDGALNLNAGNIIGRSPVGYVQCFVYDDPPRVATIWEDSGGTYGRPHLPTGERDPADVRWTTYYGYLKVLDQVDDSISWMYTHDDYDVLPAGAASAEDAFGPGWHLACVPLQPPAEDASVTLAGLDQGANNLVNNLYRYDPGSGYRIYPGQFTQIDAGKAYWVRLEEEGDIDMLGTSAPSEADIPLAVGWNMIGPPRSYPVLLEECKVRQTPGGWPVTWLAATTLDWIDWTLYYYEDGYKTLRASGGDDDTLRPWHGYWVLCNEPGAVLVVPQPDEPDPILTIEGVGVSSITPTTAVVSWTSRVHATTRVDFGLSGAYEETTGTHTGLSRGHSMKLTGLTPDTLFYYRATSTSSGYAPGVFEGTFTTAASATLPADAGFESGGLNEWEHWGAEEALVQVSTSSALGPIYPHGGSYLCRSNYASTDTNGGLYARVAATPGNTYEASVRSNLYMMKNTEPYPADEDCRSRVGIDPTGGRDPYSASIVWSGWDQRPNKTPPAWVQLSAQAAAQAEMVTIFLEFDQCYDAGYVQMTNTFDDAAIAEVGP